MQGDKIDRNICPVDPNQKKEIKITLIPSFVASVSTIRQWSSKTKRPRVTADAQGQLLLYSPSIAHIESKIFINISLEQVFDLSVHVRHRLKD